MVADSTQKAKIGQLADLSDSQEFDRILHGLEFALVGLDPDPHIERDLDGRSLRPVAAPTSNSPRTAMGTLSLLPDTPPEGLPPESDKCALGPPGEREQRWIRARTATSEANAMILDMPRGHVTGINSLVPAGIDTKNGSRVDPNQGATIGRA